MYVSCLKYFFEVNGFFTGSFSVTIDNIERYNEILQLIEAHAVLGMNSTATRPGTFPVYLRAFHMHYAYHCHYLSYSQRTFWPISTLNLPLNARRNLYNNGLARRTAEWPYRPFFLLCTVYT